MPTTFVKGDLFEDSKGPDLYALAFPAECNGEMSQGVAVAFKKRWPALEEALRSKAGSKGLEVGEVFTWRDENVVVYALAVLQGTAKPKLGALTRAIDTMIARASEEKLSRIAIARIGGFDPKRVKSVLTDAGEKTTLNLVVFEQFVRRPTATTED